MVREIAFCYRKIIDNSSAGAWEKLVFEDTHFEYKLQAQQLDPHGQYPAFAQLEKQIPNAKQLHNAVSAAAINYLRQLQDNIPDILDNLGKRFLTFKNFRLEIINSHTSDVNKHKIAISFYSDPMLWIETVGSYLLVAPAQQTEEPLLTHLMTIQPYLSIYSIKP